MNTIILAAGQGTRLRPYTDEIPKCMVALAGKPLLHWQLSALRACGIADNITIVGGYKAEKLDAPGVRVVMNPRFASTNMVATLFCAREAMVAGEDLLICYGDIVYEPRVLQALLHSQAPLAITADSEWKRLWQLRMDDPLQDAETFRMNAQGFVLELGKKPRDYSEVQAQYMGLIRVRGDRVAQFCKCYAQLDRNARYDGKDFDNMYMTSFLQYLIDHGWETEACLVHNGWLEIDTAAELEQYQQMHDRGHLSGYCHLTNGDY